MVVGIVNAVSVKVVWTVAVAVTIISVGFVIAVDTDPWQEVSNTMTRIRGMIVLSKIVTFPLSLKDYAPNGECELT